MVDIVEISAIVAAVGVLVGVVYYILDMRNQTRIRQTDLLMRLYQSLYSREFNEALTLFLSADLSSYDAVVQKYGPIPSNHPTQIAFQMVASYFEGVGELLHKKLIDINTVEDLFNVQLYWEKAEPLMKDLRKQMNSPRLFDWFEYLYDEVKKREQKLQQSKVRQMVCP